MDGKELYKIRSLLAWSQATMAFHVGLTTNTIARQERGEVKIGEPEARLIRLLYEQERKPRRKRKEGSRQ